MIYWILATLTAFFIKGLCGFANTLVFTSILSFGIVNANISPVELLIGYPSNLILVWKKRTSLHPRIFFLPMLFVLAGSIPGAFILKYITANIVKIIFGIVVIMSGDILPLPLQTMGLYRRFRRQITVSMPGADVCRRILILRFFMEWKAIW